MPPRRVPAVPAAAPAAAARPADGIGDLAQATEIEKS